MLIEQWIKSKYSYICFLTLWLVIDGWFIYQFQSTINSNQSPDLVKETCESILERLFYINLFFTSIGIGLSILFFQQRKNAIPFVLTYLIHTAFTIFNSFQLNDALIHYTQRQGVWGGGSPMGDFLYVLLLLLIGLFVVAPYTLWRSFWWLRAKFRNRLG